MTMLCYANLKTPKPVNDGRVKALMETVCSSMAAKSGEQVKVFVDGEDAGVLSVRESDEVHEMTNANITQYHFESMKRKYLDTWPIPDGTSLKPWIFYKVVDQIYTNTYWVEAYGFRLDFAWVGKNNTNFFTGNYAPIPELAEDHDNFMSWIELLKDNAYTVEQVYMQEMMNETYNNHPAAIAAMEERLIELSEIASWFKWDAVRTYDEPIALLNHAVKPKTKFEIEEEKANNRAKALINSWLSKDELESWEKKHEVILNSKLDEDIIYIFKRDKRVEVQSKSKNKIVANLCVYPGADEHLCSNDVLLGNILACKSNEEKWIEGSHLFQKGMEGDTPQILVTINARRKKGNYEVIEYNGEMA